MSTPKLSWIEYFAWADPDTPYLRLFRSIAQVAYVALGGDVVDQCLAAARQMDAAYHRGQAEALNPDDARRARPVGHREGAGARRDCWKYEAGGRKRFEEACELVRKLFRSVLGYDAILPHEPEETREHKPEDPEMMRKIEQRAENLRGLRPPAPQRAHAPSAAPLDEDTMRQNVVLREQLRKADMQVYEMQRAVMAMQQKIADGVTPEESQRVKELIENTRQAAPTHTSATPREQGRFTTLVLGPEEPTAETLAPFPPEDHEEIKRMWHQVQDVQRLGAPQELIRRAVQGDRQAEVEIDRLIAQSQLAGA